MSLPQRLPAITRAIAGVSCVLIAACHRAPINVSVPRDSAAASASADAASATTSSPAAASPALTPPTPRARVPRDAARFEIDAVDDSTARFKPREATWVAEGMEATIVDPMHRDVLVARARVVSVWNATAVAVVTAQFTRVTSEHVVLMTPPIVPWWKTRRFWLGSLLGFVVGGTGGALLAR